MLLLNALIELVSLLSAKIISYRLEKNKRIVKFQSLLNNPIKPVTESLKIMRRTSEEEFSSVDYT